jgi:uncharacterized membrane protein YvbJ
MALISCPECGKQISNAANSCPHCGFPICNQATSNKSEEKTVRPEMESQHSINSKSIENQNSEDISKGCSVLVIIILLIAFVMLFRGCDSDSSSEGYGDYTSPSGKRQIQYQGSREQQRDLDLIDSYFGY